MGIDTKDVDNEGYIHIYYYYLFIYTYIYIYGHGDVNEHGHASNIINENAYVSEDGNIRNK